MSRSFEDLTMMRGKSSDMSIVKRFNCWRNNSGDVTIIKQMNAVKGALSIIQLLEDYRKLQLVYSRKDFIHHLNEMSYLKNQSHIKYLRLRANSCDGRSAIVKYRTNALRALPSFNEADSALLEKNDDESANNSANNHMHEGKMYSSAEKVDTYFKRERPYYHQRQHRITRPLFSSTHTRSRANTTNYGREEPTGVYAAVHMYNQPVHRSACVLSAILCLIEELDYTSLYAIDHILETRINELTSAMQQ